MMPILYDSTESSFASLGIGALPDATRCTVKEELGGVYEMTMTYPVSGVHAAEIASDRIIAAPNNDQDKPQPFRIYSVHPSLNGHSITVKAEHISYQLNHIPVAPFRLTNIGAVGQELAANMLLSSPFIVTTDLESSMSYPLDRPYMARTILKTLADQYGGELEYDRFDVKLQKQRGQDNGVVVAYGKNLSFLEQEHSIADVVDAVCPYWAQNGEVVMGGVLSILHPQYSYRRVKLVDMTSEFPSKPSTTQLGEMADMWLEYNAVEALVAMQLGYVPLWQTAQHKQTAPYERVRLGDTITVRCEPLRINAKTRITSLTYDVLRRKNVDVRVGTPKQSLDRTLAKLLRAIGT